jgi:hypothetical protein
MSLKYNKTPFGFLVWKQTIWQPFILLKIRCRSSKCRKPKLSKNTEHAELIPPQGLGGHRKC